MGNLKSDVIVIGGGIGGLICAGYLARAGMKVLLIEKNERLGGYCQSFSIGRFSFTTCIRGVVGCRKGGLLRNILDELNITHKLSFIRPPVYDLIQFNNKSVALHNKPETTISEIVNYFPKEADAIRDFFGLLSKEGLSNDFFRFRNLTFQQIVDKYFQDKELKFLLNILRIDSGDPPSKTSAIADLMLIRGNIYDGGYYPKGGMQRIPDILEEFIIENKGEIIKQSLVDKIIFKNKRAVGVQLKNGSIFSADVIVSNSDARNTYNKLIGKSIPQYNLLRKINVMKPSASTFIMYLAINKSVEDALEHRCSAIWNFYKSIGDGIVCVLNSVIDPQMAPPNNASITVYYGMPFKNEDYWQKNKEHFAGMFIQRFLRVFPNLCLENISVLRIMTPYDLSSLTLNSSGASRGWAPELQQGNLEFPSSFTPFPNLFLVGHWVASNVGNGGVAFAARTGEKVAKHIIKKWPL